MRSMTRRPARRSEGESPLFAPGKLFWKFFLGTSLIIAAVLATCFALMIYSMDRTRAAEVRRRLLSDANTMRHLIGPQVSAENAGELNGIVRQLNQGAPEHIRITAILRDGRVIADSEADPATMEPHGDRPEVIQALSDGTGEDSRLSHTMRERMQYVAVRVGSPEAPMGVIRVAMSQEVLDEQTRFTHRVLLSIGGVGLLASLALALGLARLWSRPIRLITRTARSLSRGDLSARVAVSGNDELAMLARSLNEMRDHLAAQLETIDGQRRTLQSLISQLHEGVVVSDSHGRIVLINPASLRHLGIPRSAGPARAIEGRAVTDFIPQADIQRMLLIKKGSVPAEENERLQESRIQTHTEDGELFVLARASDILLPGPGGDARETPKPMVGRLLVLTDVTDLAKMIQVKADFAANASHELRTPLSAIRVAVETLMQVDFAQDGDSARHFLGVVDRHSSRLEMLVADLLNLSKIETSPQMFQPGTMVIRELLGDLRGRFGERMESKGLEWVIDVRGELATIEASPHLVRLVLDNLLDNAIKFTESGGQIRLGIRKIGVHELPLEIPVGTPAVAFEVADTGCGIPEEDQDRVFERFYQVERARSGSPTRGTGLGLSIVRHAVAAMKGTVDLRSRLGQGTTITITLPQPSPRPT